MAVKGTRLAPFVPSGPDYARALAFFEAIGFEAQWQYPGVAGLAFGEAYFILQEADVPEWQTNQMIVLEVTDLGDYWSELQAKGLPDRFPGVVVKPPQAFPWGTEVHLIDPAGVCWHVRQAA